MGIRFLSSDVRCYKGFLINTFFPLTPGTGEGPGKIEERDYELETKRERGPFCSLCVGGPDWKNKLEVFFLQCQLWSPTVLHLGAEASWDTIDNCHVFNIVCSWTDRFCYQGNITILLIPCSHVKRICLWNWVSNRERHLTVMCISIEHHTQTSA